jgi:hypothetical protein
LEARLGISASYMFRSVGESNDPTIIKEISSLGHEIGYHYESLTTCKGDLEKGIEDFRSNLEQLRKLSEVKVISMHGSPKSPHDSRDLWKEYNYRDFGIVCEPYFDVDYSKVLYLTDTGRRWNGDKVNVRDKVKYSIGITSGEPLSSQFNFKSTSQIIEALKRNKLPDKLIINTHPQRWTDKPLPWIKELVFQNAKNVVKYFLIKTRSN